jgi:transcriptional regulator with XRE-family HTH domain
MAELSSAAAIREAVSRFGLTQKQVGTALGVSDRMVRLVLSGKKPGRNLEKAARQLAAEGRVTERPERRQQRVRVRGGGTEPVGPKVERSTTVEGRGRSQVTIEFPPRGLGRFAAGQAVLDELDAHRGAQRVTVRIVTKERPDGYTIGGRRGYVARTMRQRIEDDGDDALEWLVEEAQKIAGYDELDDLTEGNIIRVVLTFYT